MPNKLEEQKQDILNTFYSIFHEVSVPLQLFNVVVEDMTEGAIREVITLYSKKWELLVLKLMIFERYLREESVSAKKNEQRRRTLAMMDIFSEMFSRDKIETVHSIVYVTLLQALDQNIWFHGIEEEDNTLQMLLATYDRKAMNGEIDSLSRPELLEYKYEGDT